jgi:hypothetical protein
MANFADRGRLQEAQALAATVHRVALVSNAMAAVARRATDPMTIVRAVALRTIRKSPIRTTMKKAIKTRPTKPNRPFKLSR